jgi:hypothetical protein
MKKDVWYVQFEKSEFGPLTEVEAIRVIKSGRFKGPSFVRRFGSDKWVSIEQVSELKSISEVVQKQSPKESREGGRFTMLSTCKYKFNSEVGVGVCRDISETGIFIISNVVPPFDVNIEISITPLDERLAKEFNVTGKVQRLEDGKEGFAIKFETASKDLIELLRAQNLHERAG